ncbi:MAG TPA: Gfo/Idh/MocA family oxidoreductase [Thermogutta sp.]|nr:Gfo/Idh/MocA family oxidoreductase [Thermogutta sp.]
MAEQSRNVQGGSRTARHGANRRQFLAAGGAVAVSILEPSLIFGTHANEKVRLGLIGCGNRGRWIARLFRDHGGYVVSAVHDYFPSRAKAVGGEFAITEDRCYSGLLGYRRMLDAGGIDAVVIESPPYFHPEQAVAAVEAGVHVFLAKPVAVDVMGCQTIQTAGEKATAKKLVFLVDFQTRTSPLYQEAVRRVREGDIGTIVSGEAVYYCGPTWVVPEDFDPKNPEDLLRAWGAFRVLSGDVITEQNIHALDVATWFLDAAPLRAYGMGGRKGKTGPGDCWDHFSVIFTFPNDVLVTFASKQYGAGYDDIGCRIFGTEGTADTHYFGTVSIHGKKPFPGGSTGSLYADGAKANIKTFYDAIKNGDFSNPTVAPSVRSNLTTILGRMAAYQKSEVTWDQMLASQERWEFDVTGLKE